MLAREFATLFSVIRYAGVAYLIWLAWRIWRAPVDAPDAAGADERGRSFLGALSLTLGNPKVIVFFLSIMPLVVDVHTMSAAAFAEIAAIMPLVLAPVLLGYALVAARARVLFRSTRALKIVNRSAAAVMAGAAIAIVTR